MKGSRLGLSILFLLLFTGTVLQAQSKKYKIDGRKCARTEITDPGELYSTYDLSDSDIESLRSQKVKSKLIDKIIAAHKETNWPAKLGSLDARMQNPEQMKAYVVYKVATVNDIIILVAPAKYNNTFPEGWSLTQDIFFIVNQNALKP